MKTTHDVVGKYRKDDPYWVGAYPKFYPSDTVEVLKGKFRGREAIVLEGQVGEWGGYYSLYLPSLDTTARVKSTNLTLLESGVGTGDPRLRYPHTKVRIMREAVGCDPRASRSGDYLTEKEKREMSSLAREMARRFKAPEGYRVAQELDYWDMR